MRLFFCLNINDTINELGSIIREFFSKKRYAMARFCPLTKKRPQVGYKVSHSHIRTKKRQLPNLQSKRIWVESQNRFIKLRLSTRALRTLRRMSIEDYARKNGLNLAKL